MPPPHSKDSWNHIFKPFLRKFVLVFFDDIHIYSLDWPTHLHHLDLVLNTLEQHELVAKHSKCAFGVQQIEYLGHLISKEGVATDPSKLKAIQQWPRPKTLKQLRGSLGLTGYYRRFIKNFGNVAKPLTNLLKKDSWVWTNDVEQAFANLRTAMMSPPVLALPNFNEVFIIETDASNHAIGAVLMQKGHQWLSLARPYHLGTCSYLHM